MRKVATLFLTMTLIVSLVGCGSQTSPDASANDGKGEVNWPTENVTLYVPASAGGGTDNYARVVAEYFKKVTGQTLVIENQAAGSGVVAYEAVRNAKPDGNTLLFYHSSLNIAHYSGLYDQDVMSNFLPIASITKSYGNVLCVSAKSAWNTLDDVVEDAKGRPDSIVAGIQAAGFPEYLINFLEKSGGCTFRKVDAGNANDRLTALLGGNIDICIMNANAAQQYEKSGDVRVLAICSSNRADIYPDWPSTQELGYEGVEIPTDCIIYGQAGMSQDLAEKINSVFLTMAEDPDFKEDLSSYGCMVDVQDLAGSYDAAKRQDDIAKSIFESD